VVLFNLENFLEEIEPQVDLISGEESDTSAFMKIMSIFIKVIEARIPPSPPPLLMRVSSLFGFVLFLFAPRSTHSR